VSGFIHPCFLDLRTSWKLFVSFMQGSLYPRGKSPRYPLNKKLGGSQIWSGWYEEWKLLILLWLKLRSLSCPAHKQLLYRLHYPGFLKVQIKFIIPYFFKGWRNNTRVSVMRASLQSEIWIQKLTKTKQRTLTTQLWYSDTFLVDFSWFQFSVWFDLPFHSHSR
jgi:hypothetical protein